MRNFLGRITVFTAGILLAALGGAEVFCAARTDAPSDPFDAVRARIARILKDSSASGLAVAIAKDGKIVWEQGFGFAARDGKTPVTPDTMFSLASITKALTATGLMVLVERGLISLDAPANDYLGTAKLTSCVDGSPAATVKNLIDHTSGLPMHYHLFYADDSRRPPSMDESIKTYGILTGRPGEAYNYSNFGYGILGRILARQSGKTYAAFMKDAVFDPLGLTRTMILVEPVRLDNVAAKYDAGKKELPVCDFDHQGASAAYASVHDLLRFGMFHLGDDGSGRKRILKDMTLAAMHNESGSEVMDGDVPVKYLLGSLARLDYSGNTFHSVTGGMPGAVSRLDMIPSEHIASAVLANSDNVDLWALQQEIFAALLPAFRNEPSKPASADEGGAKGRFNPPDALQGVWEGTIRTSEKTIPAKMVFPRGSEPVLEIEGKRYYPVPVKTELGDPEFKAGVFSGLFWGRIDTPDTAGRPHTVYINVRLRAGKLSGSAAAVSIDGRRTFCLPHWIELAKSVQ